MTGRGSATVESPTQRLKSIETVPRARWLRLGIIYLGLGILALVMAPEADPDAWWLHGVWCFAGLAVAAPTLMCPFRQGFSLVLTDHRMTFLGAFSLYFLFGASLLAVGPEDQVTIALAFYPVGVKEILRADAVNGIGFGLALMTAALSRGRWLQSQAGWVAARVGRLPTNLVVGSFLVIGGGASLYVLPYDLGVLSGFPPGIVRTAGRLSMVAIFLAVSSQGRHERILRFSGIALAIGLAGLGVLKFTKTETLLALGVMVAGLAMRFGSKRVLPIGLAVLVGSFIVLGSLARFGRGAVLRTPGNATLADRTSFLTEGWAGDTPGAEGEYPYWVRLCYAPTQSAGMDLQDAGLGGDGLELALWVLVPRAVAPGKPEITKIGRELNAKITGSDQSNSGQGIFSSGYYHGGWWAFVGLSALCGWFLAQTSAIARVIHAYDASAMLPLSLLGMYMAFRIDGDVVPDYIGTFVVILYPLLAVAVLRAMSRFGRRAPAS